MKCVIMAAGKGTRMLPLTEKVPKVLVEINGKPFLYYVMKTLQKAGFSEFGLIIGYRKEQFPSFLKKYEFKATLIEQREQLGTGHALMQAESFANNENFISLGGDNLWNVEDFKAVAKDDDMNYVGGFKVKNPEKYGVLVEKDNKLIEIVEKPRLFIGDLINTALYKFTPEIFKELKKVRLSERSEIELPDAVNSLAEKGKVKVVEIKKWIDLGCVEDIPKVEKDIAKLF